MKPCGLPLTAGARLWLVCLLLFAVSWNVQARITRVSFAPNETAQCMEAGLPALTQGTKRWLRIEGSWTDWTRLIKATGGVSGRVLRTNAAPSWVDVELQATANADIGDSQVTLDYPLSKDTFNVMVLERQQVDSVRVMKPFEQTFRYINLLISGRHLETLITPQITLDTSSTG